jgi:hypothetical protein
MLIQPVTKMVYRDALGMSIARLAMSDTLWGSNLGLPGSSPEIEARTLRCLCQSVRSASPWTFCSAL